MADTDSKRSARTKLLVGAGVLTVMALGVAGALVVISGGGSTGGANSDLLYLAGTESDDGDAEFSFTRVGNDERPVEFWDGDFQPAQLLGRDLVAGVDALSSGGPIVGVGSESSEDEVTAFAYDPDSEEMTVLHESTDPLEVWFGQQSERVYVREFGDGRQSCLVGDLEDEADRVLRSDACFFSDAGDYVVGVEFTAEGVEFEVVDLDGSEVFASDALRAPSFTPDDGHLVFATGSVSESSYSLLDLDSGDVVAESASGGAVTLLDSVATGVLVGIAADGEAIVEQIRTDGSVETVFESDGSIAAGFLNDDGTRILVRSSNEDGVSAHVVDTDGAADPTLIADDVAFAELSRQGGSGSYVVWSQTEGGSDAEVLVGNGDADIDFDIDDVSAMLASWSPDADAVVLEAVHGDGTKSLWVVDVAAGEANEVLEGWSVLEVADAAADGALLIIGREDSGDDVALGEVSRDGDFDELDEPFLVLSAAYTDDERNVVSSVVSDDFEEVVEVYERGDDSSDEEIADDARLFSTGWGGDPLLLFEAMRDFGGSPAGNACVDLRPDLVQLSAAAPISADYPAASEYCLEVATTSGYLITVTSPDFDTTLGLVTIDPDAAFELDEFNDDSDDGLNSGLELFLEAGEAYLVTVGSFDGDGGRFTLEIVNDPQVEEPEVVQVDEEPEPVEPEPVEPEPEPVEIEPVEIEPVETTAIDVAVLRNPAMEDIINLTLGEFTDVAGIEVNFTVVEEQELREIILAQDGSSGGEFDVVMVGAFEAPQFGENGWLQDLSDYADNDAAYDKDDILPAVIDNISVDGRQYASPFYTESSILMYRVDLLEEAGLVMPDAPTWAEVDQIARAIDTDDTAGICLRGRPGWGDLGASFTTVLNTFGGTWWEANDDGTIGASQVDQPEFREALEFYVDLEQSAGVDDAETASFVECLTLYQEGAVAMWYDATVAAGILESDGSPVRGLNGFAQAPVVATPSSGWLWSWNLAMPADAPDPDAAWEFISWATGPDFVVTAGENLGWENAPPATRQSLFDNENYQEVSAPFGEQVREAVAAADPNNPGTSPRPGLPGVQYVGVPEFQDIGNRCTELFASVIAEDMTIDEAIEQCQEIASEVST